MSLLSNGRSLILGAFWLEFSYQTTDAPLLTSTLLLFVVINILYIYIMLSRAPLDVILDIQYHAKGSRLDHSIVVLRIELPKLSQSFLHNSH